MLKTTEAVSSHPGEKGLGSQHPLCQRKTKGEPKKVLANLRGGGKNVKRSIRTGAGKQTGIVR
jgi:hypothetical protein